MDVQEVIDALCSHKHGITDYSEHHRVCLRCMANDCGLDFRETLIRVVEILKNKSRASK